MDEAVGVDDQHPILHVADYQSVDAQLVGKVDATLLRQAFVQDQPPRELIGDQRRREIADRQQAGLQKKFPVLES